MPRPPRRQRSRSGRLLVVLLVIAAVLGAFVLADTLVRHHLESRAAALIQQKLELEQRPDVGFGGFPFSFFAAQRQLRNVTITVPEVIVTASDRRIAVTQVSIDADPVDIDANNAAVAGTVRGAATIPWAELAAAGGYDNLTFEAPNRVVMTRAVTIEEGSDPLSAKVSVVPTLDVGTQQLSFTDAKVSVEGLPLSSALSDLIVSRVASPLSVKQTNGLTVDSLSVSADGCRVGFTGSNIDLNTVG